MGHVTRTLLFCVSRNQLRASPSTIELYASLKVLSAELKGAPTPPFIREASPGAIKRLGRAVILVLE